MIQVAEEVSRVFKALVQKVKDSNDSNQILHEINLERNNAAMQAIRNPWFDQKKIPSGDLLLWVHYVNGFAFNKMADILGSQLHEPLSCFYGSPGYMWRNNTIWCL